METSSHVTKFLCIFLFGILYFSEENLKLSRPVVDHGCGDFDKLRQGAFSSFCFWNKGTALHMLSVFVFSIFYRLCNHKFNVNNSMLWMLL